MSRSIDSIKHMKELSADKEAEDIIRDIEIVKQELQKNDCNAKQVLQKLDSCKNSMKFILHELR